MRRALAWLLAPVTLVLAFLLATDPGAEFATDEAEWLTISAAHWAQLTGDGDPWHGLERPPDAGRDRWREGIHASTFGAMNPGLPKVVLGALQAAAGHTSWSPLLFPRFNRVKEQKRAAGELVRPGLAAGRALSALLFGGCALLLFAAGRAVAGVPAGFTAWALWLASPIARDAAGVVRTDLWPILWTLAALLAAVRLSPLLAGERGSGRALLAGAAVGLLAGLALASKPNGAVAALLIVPWVSIARLRARSGGRSGPALLAAGTALGVAGLSFLVFCPALWGSPPEIVTRVGETLRLWRGDTLHRQRNARDVEVAVDLAGRISLVRGGALGRHEPWTALTGLPGGAAWLVLSALALVFALRDRMRGTAAWMALAWLAVLLVATTLWIPMDWDRYHLPLLAPVALGEGVLVGWLWRRLRSASPKDPLERVEEGVAGGPGP